MFNTIEDKSLFSKFSIHLNLLASYLVDIVFCYVFILVHRNTSSDHIWNDLVLGNNWKKKYSHIVYPFISEWIICCCFFIFSVYMNICEPATQYNFNQYNSLVIFSIFLFFALLIHVSSTKHDWRMIIANLLLFNFISTFL